MKMTHCSCRVGFCAPSAVQSDVVSEDVVADKRVDPDHSRQAPSAIRLTCRQETPPSSPSSSSRGTDQEGLYEIDAIVSTGFHSGVEQAV